MAQCQDKVNSCDGAEVLRLLFGPPGTEALLHYSSQQDGYHPSRPSHRADRLGTNNRPTRAVAFIK
jgi:hypothetical protein